MNEDQVLGIDIGGSGIKGAIVNIKTGKLVTERFRIDTPKPSKPKAVAEVVAQIVKHFKWKGLIGIGFPSHWLSFRLASGGVGGRRQWVPVK